MYIYWAFHTVATFILQFDLLTLYLSTQQFQFWPSTNLCGSCSVICRRCLLMQLLGLVDDLCLMVGSVNKSCKNNILNASIRLQIIKLIWYVNIDVDRHFSLTKWLSAPVRIWSIQSALWSHLLLCLCLHGYWLSHNIPCQQLSKHN